MNAPPDWRKLQRWETAFDPLDGELVLESHIGDHNIRVLENERYRWLCFDQLLQSGMLLAHPDELLFNYARTMLGFRLFLPDPSRLLLLGLGAGSIARYLLRYQPALTVTAVDYSADVIAIARDYFGLPRVSGRLNVVHRDARDYLRESTAVEDVILVDLFGAFGTPEWMASDQLYAACRARLSGNGIIAVNLLVHDEAHIKHLLAPILRVFDRRVLHTTPDEYDNLIAFAFNGPCPALNDPQLRARASELEMALGLPLKALLSDLAWNS